MMRLTKVILSLHSINSQWIRPKYEADSFLLRNPAGYGDSQCCEKIFMRIPRKSGENPHKIPHSNEISPLWGKSGFYCIFINKSFGSGHKHEQIYEPWTSFEKTQFHTYLN